MRHGSKEEIKNFILGEAEKGKICYMTIDGIVSTPVDEFIKQPVQGMLYDLNRSHEVILTFIDDPKWVNDYAVMLVITRLKAMVDESTEKKG